MSTQPITVITGAAGFLGSHLCDRFLQEGHKVIGIDNFITGNPDNLAHLFGHPHFKFIRHDVSNYIYIEGRVDNVLHFASPASPIDYLKIPIQTLKVGSLGTHNALGLAKAKNARFMIASTSEVYGDPLEHPQKETYWGHVNPVGLRGCYDEAKRFAEAMTMAYHRHHGLNTRIVRIFNTYGERMRLDDGRALPSFVSSAIKGEAMTVFGDGSQTRSFCHVSDLIEGIWRLLHTDFHEPVNIGNPSEITILDFAKEVQAIVREFIGKEIPIIYKPLPADDPKQRRPDITRAKELLGWEPKVSRAEGLRKTIEFFLKQAGQL
ncbi:MAG: UDP-glucuronic acid decarboxylase family protein [Candidatus Thermochlorobacter sp.]